MALPTTIIVLGPPGSGKGTQGDLLANHFNYFHLSVGELVRAAAKQAGPKSSITKRMRKGMPQTDAVVNKLIDTFLKTLKTKKILFDAHPLSMGEARGLDRTIHTSKLGHPIVFYLDVSEKEVIQRLAFRRRCPAGGESYGPLRGRARKVCPLHRVPLLHREDDKPHVIKVRYKEYQKRYTPVLEFYKKHSNLFVVNGERTPRQIFKELVHILHRYESHQKHRRA